MSPASGNSRSLQKLLHIFASPLCSFPDAAHCCVMGHLIDVKIFSSESSLQISAKSISRASINAMLSVINEQAMVKDLIHFAFSI